MEVPIRMMRTTHLTLAEAKRLIRDRALRLRNEGTAAVQRGDKADGVVWLTESAALTAVLREIEEAQG